MTATRTGWVILSILLWLVYTVLTYESCADQICLECVQAGKVVPGPEDDSSDTQGQRYPVDFKWSDPTAYVSDQAKFDEYKKGILANMTADNILEITGTYFEGESAPEGFENMGLARAEQLKQLFLKDIPEDRIKLRARAFEEREGVRTQYFEAGLFKWEEPKKRVEADAGVDADAVDEEDKVEILDDRIIIRFPYNSTERIEDPTIEEYLKKLASQIIQTGETVTLTGHTDNKGTPEYNQELGMARARATRQTLIDDGVDPSQIAIDSKGQTQPVASNATDEGRQENRRVELRLIKAD